mgnify:CR=1 FL=1
MVMRRNSVATSEAPNIATTAKSISGLFQRVETRKPTYLYDGDTADGRVVQVRLDNRTEERLALTGVKEVKDAEKYVLCT